MQVRPLVPDPGRHRANIEGAEPPVDCTRPSNQRRAVARLEAWTCGVSNRALRQSPLTRDRRSFSVPADAPTFRARLRRTFQSRDAGRDSLSNDLADGPIPKGTDFGHSDGRRSGPRGGREPSAKSPASQPRPCCEDIARMGELDRRMQRDMSSSFACQRRRARLDGNWLCRSRRPERGMWLRSYRRLCDLRNVGRWIPVSEIGFRGRSADPPKAPRHAPACRSGRPGDAVVAGQFADDARGFVTMGAQRRRSGDALQAAARCDPPDRRFSPACSISTINPPAGGLWIVAS